jgi:N-dimethylarginine dimethylaminohydrolase
MVHESRRKEVPFYTGFFKQNGYKVLETIPNKVYEGMGDLIPVPGKRLIFGGYGYRTDSATFDVISKSLQAPIIPIKLINPNFYHLDTCFIPVTDDIALVVEEAFDEKSLQFIKTVFSTVIPIPLGEATNFALNAHVIHSAQNKRYAILQNGNKETATILSDLCEQVFEVETAEFMKSGGSVFCMKMMYF